MISHLSLVEMESVLAIKMRTREIDNQRWRSRGGAFGLIWRSRESWSRRLCLSVICRSRESCWFNTECLKGFAPLDALQLAIALDLRQFEQIDVFVAADQRLCRVASMAGCTSINPETPGLVLP